MRTAHSNYNKQIYIYIYIYLNLFKETRKRKGIACSVMLLILDGPLTLCFLVTPER
jgi:hypothetical protein